MIVWHLGEKNPKNILTIFTFLMKILYTHSYLTLKNENVKELYKNKTYVYNHFCFYF